MKGTNSWQWYTATHKTKSERLCILLISPTLFAKFNLPQHRLALRSNKREAKGRSALKATVEEEDENRDVQTSYLWTKESVVQMFEGKQGNYLSAGAVPH